jgi:hypothetical protein
MRPAKMQENSKIATLRHEEHKPTGLNAMKLAGERMRGLHGRKGVSAGTERPTGSSRFASLADCRVLGL